MKLQHQAVPIEEWDLLKALEPIVRPEMQRQNGRHNRRRSGVQCSVRKAKTEIPAKSESTLGQIERLLRGAVACGVRSSYFRATSRNRA